MRWIVNTSAVLLAVLTLTSPASAEPSPSAVDILRRADAILAPRSFEGECTYVAHRSKGSPRSFSMKLWKKDADKLRVRFLAPADDRDAEVLRLDDDMWNYLPNLKRAIRISPKQEFHGGDFSNSDILRVNLAEDYVPVLLASKAPDEWLLELTAKNDEVAYHRIRYAIRKKDFMPLRQEFFTASGKLVRKLELSAPKAFGKHIRPSFYVMKNMLVPARRTEMEWTRFTVKDFDDDSLFQQSSLGR
jgi:outer membrane lipoprotein-sorting protein